MQKESTDIVYYVILTISTLKSSSCWLYWSQTLTSKSTRYKPKYCCRGACSFKSRCRAPAMGAVKQYYILVYRIMHGSRGWGTGYVPSPGWQGEETYRFLYPTNHALTYLMNQHFEYLQMWFLRSQNMVKCIKAEKNWWGPCWPGGCHIGDYWTNKTFLF